MNKFLKNIKANFARQTPAQTEETQTRPRRRRTPGKFRQLLPKVLMVVFAATFLFSGFQIIRNVKQATKRDELYTELTDIAVKPASPSTSASGNSNNQTPDGSDGTSSGSSTGGLYQDYSPIAVDFQYLSEKNPDIMAWVYCPGTPINYPVVRGEDNDYYLNRLFDGTVNKSGSIFADYRNMVDFSDPHTIIYGHNMKDMSMFGSINKYTEQAYYDEHPVWYINTPGKNYAVVLLAGYIAAPNAEIYAFKGTSEEPTEILQTAIKKSTFDAKAAALPGEPLVTFSTCHGNSRRFVLVGVLREIV